MNELQTLAIKGLEGMAEIVRNEMVEAGSYISSDIDQSRATAICRGHKACAIGSLWLGYGIQPKRHIDLWGAKYWELPGVDDGLERIDFLAEHPGLKFAYDNINAAADAWIAVHPEVMVSRTTFTAPIEALFESSFESHCSRSYLPSVRRGVPLTRQDLLDIIADAIQRVETVEMV